MPHAEAPDVQAALPRDSAAVAEIYDQGIEERSSTFETELRSAAAVDHGARGRGVGRRLLEALERHARKGGYHELTGRLFTDNEASGRDVLVVERLLQ